LEAAQSKEQAALFAAQENEVAAGKLAVVAAAEATASTSS